VPPEEFEIVDENGDARTALISRHSPGISRRFRECEPLLIAAGAARSFLFYSTPCVVLDGGLFKAVMLEKVAADPLFLLASTEREKWQLKNHG